MLRFRFPAMITQSGTKDITSKAGVKFTSFRVFVPYDKPDELTGQTFGDHEFITQQNVPKDAKYLDITAEYDGRIFQAIAIERLQVDKKGFEDLVRRYQASMNLTASPTKAG